MNDIRPDQVYRETGRWFGPVLFAGVAVIVLGAILTLVGWRIGWWFTAQNATRQYQLTQNGTSNQDTLRAQVTSQLATVTTITTQIAATTDDPSEVAALKDQRAAVAGIACSDAAQITGVPLPAQQAQWVSVNCSDGSVSPSSNLYVTGAP
jgi:hypothetical protein